MFMHDAYILTLVIRGVQLLGWTIVYVLKMPIQVLKINVCHEFVTSDHLPVFIRLEFIRPVEVSVQNWS